MGEDQSAIDEAAGRICQIAKDKNAVPWLTEYFDRQGAYAGELFNTCLPNEANTIDASDLFATTLLNVEIDVRRARHILDEQRSEISRLLNEIPPTLAIFEAEPYPDGKIWAAADQLWTLLKGGWKGTGDATVIAGKILARKRPHLIPIADRVVIRAVASPSGGFWAAMQKAFEKDDLLQILEGYRAEVASIPALSSAREITDVSTLRLLDVILWRFGLDADSSGG